jgi:hypothetical protein
MKLFPALTQQDVGEDDHEDCDRGGLNEFCAHTPTIAALLRA